MENFEKLGLLYLGKVVDEEASESFLLDSKHLTTHAVCLGMTGSGKTGLGITLIEEAAIDHVPSIIIDPKGDMGNLLLNFPHLSPEEFRPWIDEAEAMRKGETPDQYAASTAENWKSGLEKWGQSGDRVKKLADSVKMEIYTPANPAGNQLSILSSFKAPSEETRSDPGAMRERVLATTSSLLGLIGLNADPIKSREHILTSSIIEHFWNQGVDLDLILLIQNVQKPPFEMIGAMPIGTFMSDKERMDLSIALNGLVASPGFKAWQEGEPLEIENLLYTVEGKPKISVLSIAHLSDSERMFFVTLVLNQLLVWMRRQPGTSSLRALLYMDEIFGYFPPTAMPPSKQPMLTLLKQARAYGLGIILATQNPVDLDYKGLANCGTWFIGKLQTERDRARVVDGLVSSSNGEVDKKELDRWLAETGKRVFIQRSIYHKEPVLFETRWALSYLRGPLTLAQISALTPKKEQSAHSNVVQEPSKPRIPQTIEEKYCNSQTTGDHVRYIPRAAGVANLHFVDRKHKIDEWKTVTFMAPIADEGNCVDWDEGDFLKETLSDAPRADSTFTQVQTTWMLDKNLTNATQDFLNHLYQHHSFDLWSYAPLAIHSKSGESEGEFRVRVALSLKEDRDRQIEKLQADYQKKIDRVAKQLQQAKEKLHQQTEQVSMQKTRTFVDIGTGILGAIFGRRVTRGGIDKLGTSVKGYGRMQKEKEDVVRAQAKVDEVEFKLQKLREELEEKIEEFPESADPADLKLEKIEIRPRKSDISVEKIFLVWKVI